MYPLKSNQHPYFKLSIIKAAEIHLHSQKKQQQKKTIYWHQYCPQARYSIVHISEHSVNVGHLYLF